MVCAVKRKVVELQGFMAHNLMFRRRRFKLKLLLGKYFRFLFVSINETIS